MKGSDSEKYIKSMINGGQNQGTEVPKGGGGGGGGGGWETESTCAISRAAFSPNGDACAVLSSMEVIKRQFPRKISHNLALRPGFKFWEFLDNIKTKP